MMVVSVDSGTGAIAPSPMSAGEARGFHTIDRVVVPKKHRDDRTVDDLRELVSLSFIRSVRHDHLAGWVSRPWRWDLQSDHD